MDSTTEEASPCVEPGFDGLPYPGFWEQVTLRSMAIAVVLAAIFSLVTLRIYMTIGVVGALNMPTNVLSFFSVKSLVSLQRRYDIASPPFTRQENIFLQTCVITCVNSAISGGLPNYIIAMNAQVAKSLRDDPDKSDIIDRIPTGKYALFLFLTGLVAITLMLPLAQVMIVDYRLLFPTGSVVAHLINSFHTQQGACAAKLQVAAIFKTFVGSFSWSMFQWFFAGGDNCGFQAFPVFGLELYKRNRFYFDFSASFVGLGMIVPHVVNIGLLFGAITSWGLLYPFLQSKRGQWYHTDSPTSLNGMNGYKIDNNQPRIKEGAESYPVTLEKQGDKFGSGFVLEDQRKDTVVVPVPSDSQFIVGTDGPFLMEKSNWPNLKITEVQHEESPMESLTQENVFSPECGLNNESFVEHKSPQAIRKGGGEMEGEDLMDVISCQSKDSDLEENSQGWQPSKSKKPKKHMKNRVVVASRTSSRISRDGIPIAEKASRRAMERNNISEMEYSA